METDIDRAHSAMSSAPEDDVARLKFYERVADSELFVLLADEPDGDQIEPELFEVDAGQFVLVFDREERLANFVGRAAPYAAVPGRGLVQMLVGQDIGLALNLKVASSAMLIPSEAVAWLDGTLSNAPEETEARLTEINTPQSLPEDVMTGLDRKLAMAAGLAATAYFAAATYSDGSKGHVLAFVDATEYAEKALAHAAGEALTFSGVAAGVLDVMFVRSGDQVAAHLAKVGINIELPQPEVAQSPKAPGMDPDKPPKLT